MNLNKLSLQNFKGLKEFFFLPEGKNIIVYGDNGTGKTTIADAFSWLITGKDSTAEAKFPVKTIRDGQEEHNLDHIVEGEFSIDGMGEVTLKKIFKEKWTKKRGQAQKTFTGNTTEHYIDGVPVTQKEYTSKVSEIMQSEETLRILTDPLYFSTKFPWEKRRNVLLEICGNVEDSQVFMSDPELESLLPVLNGKTAEEYRKVAASRRKKINEKLKGIPDRIDEVKKGTPELTVSNPDVLVKKLADLRGELAEKQKELASADITGTSDIDRKINETRSELAKDQAAFQEIETAAISEIKRKKDSLQSEKVKLESLIDSMKLKINQLESRNADLRKQFVAVNSEKFSGDTCPTCNQKLPGNEIKKALENFNLVKSETLSDINAEGKSNNEEISSLKKKIASTEKQISWLSNDIELADEKLANRPEFDQERFDKEIKKLETQKQKIKAEGKADTSLIEDDISRIEADIQKNEILVSKIEQYHSSKDRIAELEREEKKLAREFEKLEHHLYLIDLFFKAKSQALSDKVGQHFDKVSFKLFNEQVNGGITPVCETTMDGKPWSALSNGEKVNAGLDIIRTLSDHYGFWPVIFIDNNESVTSIPELTQQVISLVVSAEDKKLRVEEAAK
jgi:DNA repair exonuclease SbcCD ATPase subunit